MIKCAICNRIKQNFNHWWTLEFCSITKSFFVYPFEYSAELETPMEWETIHTCGIECLLIAESKIRNAEDPVRRIPE